MYFDEKYIQSMEPLCKGLIVTVRPQSAVRKVTIITHLWEISIGRLTWGKAWLFDLLLFIIC